MTMTTKTNAQRYDEAAQTMATAAVFARHACFNRVAEHEHGITAEACAALVNIDLHLAVAVLDGLIATGDVERAGVLYRLPPRQSTINLEKSWRIAFAKRADKERRLGIRQ